MREPSVTETGTHACTEDGLSTIVLQRQLTLEHIHKLIRDAVSMLECRSRSRRKRGEIAAKAFQAERVT